MLTSSDLLNLIRLTENELDRIHDDLNSEEQAVCDEAGEMSIQMERLAQKLEKLYCNQRSADSELPSYDEYIAIIEKEKR